MLILVLERSAVRPSWALFRDAVCLCEEIADAADARAPDWLPRMHAALTAAGVSLAEIDCFVAGLGPGSFSGTRAAVAALQGMTLPDNKPLLGLSSAAALAFALLCAKNLRTPLAVIGDARRERLWCAVYTRQQDRLALVTPAGTCPPTHTAADFRLTIWDELPALLPADAVVVSPDWDRLGTRLSETFLPARLLAGVHFSTAVDVGRLLLADPERAHREPMPIYLHPAVAEKR